MGRIPTIGVKRPLRARGREPGARVRRGGDDRLDGRQQPEQRVPRGHIEGRAACGCGEEAERGGGVGEHGGELDGGTESGGD